MYWLVIIEIVIITILVAYLIYSHCNKEVNMYVKAMALVSWLINFLLILLQPFDIYLTYRDNGELSSEYLGLADVKILF